MEGRVLLRPRRRCFKRRRGTRESPRAMRGERNMEAAPEFCRTRLKQKLEEQTGPSIQVATSLAPEGHRQMRSRQEKGPM